MLSASSLVTMSSVTIAATVDQKRRRLAALAILFLGFAVDAQSRVRQRVEAVEADLFTALLALPELLRRLVEAAQRLVDVPEVASLLRREQERFLTIHGVGPLVGHVEGVTRQVSVRSLETRVEGFVVVTELLHHTRPLFEQSLLEMCQLLLVQTLGSLRRHARVPPFRPSCRRRASVTLRPSMSTSRVMSASSNTVPSTVRRARVSPSTYPKKASVAAKTSPAPAMLSSMRGV